MAAGGGGLAAYWFGTTSSPNAELNIRENTLVGNSAYYAAGGAFLGTFGDNNFATPLNFENNLVAQNSASEPFAFGGGVAVISFAEDGGTPTFDLNLNTFFQNESFIGGSDLDISADTLNLGGVNVNVTNTMFGDIFGNAVGGLPPGGSENLNITLNWDLFNGPGQPWERSIEPWLDIVSASNHVFADPLLDGAFRPDICSPAVDAGDPGADFSEEGQPNGERVNIGFLGNTPGSQITLPDTNDDGIVDGRDALAVSSAFGATDADARYLAEADLNNDGQVDGEDLAFVGGNYGTDCR